MKNCEAPGCTKLIPNRRYCPGHYSRLQRTGELGTGEIKPQTPRGLDAWGVIQHNGWLITVDDCWEYQGPRFANGYGQVKVNGWPTLVHRVAFEHFKGPIPSGLYVMHSCDNKPCLNPEHLFVGTPLENTQDAVTRGLHKGGRHRRIFTPEQVISIRSRLDVIGASSQTYREIAEEFSVHEDTIERMYRRQTYSDIE